MENTCNMLYTALSNELLNVIPPTKFLTGLTDEEKVALEGQRLTFLRSFK